jgi:hypothetical protein
LLNVLKYENPGSAVGRPGRLDYWGADAMQEGGSSFPAALGLSWSPRRSTGRPEVRQFLLQQTLDLIIRRPFGAILSGLFEEARRVDQHLAKKPRISRHHPGVNTVDDIAALSLGWGQADGANLSEAVPCR